MCEVQYVLSLRSKTWTQSCKRQIFQWIKVEKNRRSDTKTLLRNPGLVELSFSCPKGSPLDSHGSLVPRSRRGAAGEKRDKQERIWRKETTQWGDETWNQLEGVMRAEEDGRVRFGMHDDNTRKDKRRLQDFFSFLFYISIKKKKKDSRKGLNQKEFVLVICGFLLFSEMPRISLFVLDSLIFFLWVFLI